MVWSGVKNTYWHHIKLNDPQSEWNFYNRCVCVCIVHCRKYKDATLLNEFHEMEMSHDVNSHRAELTDDNGAAASSSFVNSHLGPGGGEGLSSDEEEEINTGSYRP